MHSEGFQLISRQLAGLKLQIMLLLDRGCFPEDWLVPLEEERLPRLGCFSTLEDADETLHAAQNLLYLSGQAVRGD